MPPPPARPADPPSIRLTRWHALAVVAVLLACTGLTGLIAWQPWRPTAQLVAGAADLLGTAPALRLRYLYADPSGEEVSGAFTVTADGFASGTVEDPGPGTSSLVATPDGSAVYGDADWWLRRAPDRVSRVQDHWVQPDAAEAFPLDVPSALSPAAVADLVRAVSRDGDVVGDTIVDGVAVSVIASGDWELQLTRDAPVRVVSLAGPIESGGLHPSAATGPGAAIVPIGLKHAQDAPGGGSIALTPEPSDENNAARTRADSSDTMRGKGTTPPGMAASPAQPGEAPPKTAELPPQQPRFETELNASDCDTPTCSWSVTTTNTGNAPGTGTAYSGAIPVMPPISRPIGRLEPGASVTSVFSAANPAPPGGTINVTVIAGAFCQELYGADSKPYERLLGKGVDPAKAVPSLDKAFIPAAVAAMNRMLDEGADPAAVKDAMAKVDEYHLQPALLHLNSAGDAFHGLGATTQGLAAARTHEEAMRVVDAIDFARDLLDRSPGGKVSLTAPKDANGKEWTADVTSGEDAYRYILTTATTAAELVTVLNDATALLSPDANGTVRIRVERAWGEHADSLWNEDVAGLQSLLHQKNGGINACRDGGGGLDTLIISNRLGDHSLTPADFCTPESDPAKLKTPRHNKARDRVTEFLKERLKLSGRSGTVGERELIVPSGSKNGTGNNGYVDDWMLDENGVLHIWEVKSRDEAYKAPGELQWYRQKLLETGEYADVVLGFPLGEVLVEPGVLPSETLEIKDWDGTRSGNPTGEDPLAVIVYRPVQ
ncbi:hypothetical protein Afil01_33340 [Actinorhabdospora filicis]|uniref:Uncharacterized protein n=1 Tax=Actinorhabdospora filicis TaxID=1785913 RepID=A0A9W6SMJ7_9ACTN|nr:hypothetical protein [Actinorhabdospora filicis]GLZ78527.1 hypothetical protein Afil01_33340 [Actinorhabdospora filicis]